MVFDTPLTVPERSRLRSLITLVERGLRRSLRYWPESLAGPAVSALLFLAVLSLAGGGGAEIWPGVPLAAFVAPGLIAYSACHAAFSEVSGYLVFDKMQGMIQDVLVAPLSALDKLLGWLVAALLHGLMVGLCVALCFLPFVPLRIVDPLSLLLFALLGGLFFALLGILAGLWAEKWDQQQAAESFLILPLGLLSGTFFTLASLPEVGQWLLRLNPVFHAIDGIRAGLLGRADGDLLFGALQLLALDGLLFLAAFRLLQRGYKLKS